MIRIAACFVFLGMFCSCTTEFQLESTWKDIPIVYGLLSRQDTAHYVRIEKAFLEPGGDAAAIAQIPDSLYYPGLTVEIEKGSGGPRFALLRVDGNAEGYIRQEGPFARVPNYLYKINAGVLKLQGGEKLRLWIFRPGGLPPVTAETEILGDISPRETSPPNPVNMGYDRAVNFSWSAPLAAEIFDLRVQIRYRESTAAQPENYQPKMLEWVLTKDLLREDASERISFSVQGEAFYRYLAQQIAPSPGVRRIFDGMDLVISAGGKALADFLQVSRVNTGITSSQLTPYFSNISEGRGLFSSRSTARRAGLQLSSSSMDSLRTGKYTRSLNFQ